MQNKYFAQSHTEDSRLELAVQWPIYQTKSLFDSMLIGLVHLQNVETKCTVDLRWSLRFLSTMLVSGVG